MSANDDILKGILGIWHDLLKLQEALSQLKQYSAVARLAELSAELSTYVANRSVEEERRKREDERVQKVLVEARQRIKQAEEKIRELEGRGKKSTRAKPVKKVKQIKKARGQKVMRLASIDAVILKTALRIAGEDKSQWEAYRDHPLQFLQRCFPGNQIYVVGFGKLDRNGYLEKDLLRKALARVAERYQAWFETKFALPTNTQTEKFFNLVREKIGKPDMLKAMFETMLGRSLDKPQLVLEDVSRIE